jgi:tripartite-type tricarboxylate transporter receptor subunit TctC
MKILFAVMAVAAALSNYPAWAQDWPTRPIRLIAPFGVGGTADITARLIADHLFTTFKQQFVVENRTGAGGAIGALAIARSEPDGYTLGITNVSTMSLVPVINPKTAYNPLSDFTHIAYVAGAPVVLAVHPSANAKTLAEFVAFGKKSPKPLTYASAGVGSDGHVIGEAIARTLDVKVEHVPYRGTSQGLTDAVGGHVIFTTFTLSSTASFIREGTLKAVAVTSPERMAEYPDVPTFKELGYPALVSSTWYALSAPPNFPKDVAEKLSRELAAFLTKPETTQQLRRYGLVHQPMTMAEFNRFVAEESARWKPMIEAAGLAGKGQ